MYKKREFNSSLIKTALLLVCLLLIQNTVHAQISVKIYSYDEGLAESNISKPRIYISNTGTEPVTNCFYRYYFCVENGKAPIWDSYYLPEENVILEHVEDSLYRLVYTLTGTIYPGQNIPYPPGNSLGLHYNDWSSWDKNNDYSNNFQSTYIENEKIAVYVNGTRIYGTEPSDTSGGGGGGGGGSGGGSVSNAEIQLMSFALYSSDSTKVGNASVFTGGGAIGSNGPVEIGADAVIEGNVVSGGIAYLRSNCQINGRVTVNDTVDMHEGAYVRDSIKEYDSVAIINIPQKALTQGTKDTTINQGETVILDPGIYRDIFVDRYATLKLQPGNYVFRDFKLETDAKVVFETDPSEFIEIDIDRDMLISDRDTLQFSGFTYAPAVRIYTNDPDTIRIGCEVSIAGIITAPHAAVQFFSRSQCDGAIYAREVIIEPDIELYSGLININEDSDTDGVSNGIEINGPHPTNPLDPNDFMDYVIPSVTAIDYSVENNISLDYKFFYGEHYPESDSVPFKIDANVLKGIIAPLFQMRSFPEGFTELPEIAGYSPIGLCMNFAQVQFDTVSAGELTVPLPFPAGVFVEGNMDVLVVKKDDTYEVVTPTSIKTGYVEVVVDSDVKSIMLLRKTKNLNRAVAYLDGGMIYSRGNHARVRTDIALTGADSLSSGTFTVYYTGYTGTVTVDTFKTVSLRNIETNGSYVLGTVDEISMQNPIMVKKVRLQVPSDSIDLIQDSLNWTVNQEECLKITIKEGLSGFNSLPEPITTSYISSFSLESVSIGGDGRIFQTYGDSGIEYSYDFYLKDHLGSTRMVINSQDQITEAVAYQAYGAMIPLDSIANAPEIPAREKFTGKEFDQEGEDSANGVAGIQAYHFGARVYDPDIGVWLSVDPANQDFFVYGYCASNPIILVDPNGELWNVVGAIAGAAIMGYAGGVMSSGSFNPGDWEAQDWLSAGMGAVQGGMIGYGIGAQIDANIAMNNYYKPQLRAPEGGLMKFGGEGQPVQVASSGGIYSPSGVARGRILEGVYNIYQNEGVFLSAAADAGIPSKWLKATYLSEFTTAKRGLTGTGLAESAFSALPINRQGLKNPAMGTYGPFNLGYDARQFSNISIAQSLTFEHSTPAAARWLAFERAQLQAAGIADPSAGMVFTRYNCGACTPGIVSGYGGRTVYLMNTYFP